MRKRTVLAGLLALATSHGIASDTWAQTATFDLATGDVVRQVIARGMVLPAFTDLSPTRSDASLVLVLSHIAGRPEKQEQ